MPTAPTPRLPASPQLRAAFLVPPTPSPARLSASAFRLRSLPTFRPIRLRAPAVSASGSDPFSGWSSVGESSDGDWKGGIGGFLGAGLAGVFFVGGVTFAALSLSQKSDSARKLQMEPLPTEQGVALCFDDTTKQHDEHTDVRVHHEVSFGDSKDSECLESSKGTSEDHSYLVVNDDYSDERPDNTGASEPMSTASAIQDSENVNSFGEKTMQDDEQNALNSGDACSLASSISNEHVNSETPISYSGPPSASSGSCAVSTDTVGLDSYELLSHASSLENPATSQLDGALIQERTIDYGNSSEFSNSASVEGQNTAEKLIMSDEMISDPSIDPAKEYRESVVDSESSLEKHDNEQNILQVSDESNYWYSEFDQQEVMILSEDSSYVPSESEQKNTDTSVAHLSNFIDKESDLRSQPFESVASVTSFSAAGIPAPSLLSVALQVPPGKILIPAVVDQTQGHALAALQVLKVVESDAQPGDLCTRREYARWLVSASNNLSRNATSKVYPAMYIENCTELAFDDITPDDRDFPFIQGLAEAGMISSKLSRSDSNAPIDGPENSLFFPESPLSRQDLVSWKMALEKRGLPRVDRNLLYKSSGYIDIDKIHPDAWPALVADLSAGDQSITALAFGFTRLFQPEKPVTKGQAALALSTGDAAEFVSEELARIEAEKLADAAVNAHAALVAQVESELNTSYENQIAKERENIETLEKLVEEARLEMESLRAEREEERISLIKGRAAVDTEMEVLSKLRCEVEQQLQNLMSNKVEISFERDRISKLQKELDNENRAIVQLQYELEVERKALSMARAWAEEEAKKAREQARALEDARQHWERHGIKVVVDRDLQEDASPGVTWVTAGNLHPVDAAISRANSLVAKLKLMAADLRLRATSGIDRLIQVVLSFISTLKQQASKTAEQCSELGASAVSAASSSADELRQNTVRLSSSIGERARRGLDECKEGIERSIERISQRFKA